MPRPIIIDTDPGIDDAVAILLALAAPELEVLGLVAVGGNVPLAATVRNARLVVELAGRGEIPVYAGCPRPIGPQRPFAERAHGAAGLGSLALPGPTDGARPGHGVNFLIDTLRAAAAKTITLCALGPLTDIAAALVMAPDIVDRTAGLVLMGGASRPLSSVSPIAEFNIFSDPLAAALVFESGLPIVMVPLDVTDGLRGTPLRIASIRALGTRCGEAVAELLTPPSGRPDGSGMAMHDACVIAYLLAPELFRAREVNVAVETQSPLTIGATVIDWRGSSGRPPNARVVEEADADGLFALLRQRLAALP